MSKHTTNETKAKVIKMIANLGVIIASTTVSIPANAITIAGPQPQVWKFTNDHDNGTATDFHVNVSSPEDVEIGGGNGGTPFPDPPVISENGRSITFNTLTGGTGIAEDEMYTVIFSGFPAGTDLFVTFTFPGNDGRTASGEYLGVLNVDLFPNDLPSDRLGTVTTTPEPSSIISFLSLGILGAGVTLKRKLKPSNSIKK